MRDSRICNFDFLAGNLDHGLLLGLTDDDHPQYLLIDGTRAMTGNLDMGGNDIVDGGLATLDDLRVLDHTQVAATSTRGLNWFPTDAVNDYLQIGGAIELGFIDSPASPGTGTTYIRAIDGANDSITLDAMGTGTVNLNFFTGSGGVIISDGDNNSGKRINFNWGATNPAITSSSGTIEFGDEHLITTESVTTNKLITSATGVSTDHILLGHTSASSSDIAQICANFNGFPGGAIYFQATGDYTATASTQDSSLLLFTATDGGDTIALSIDSAQDSRFWGSLEVADGLTINDDNAQNVGLALEGWDIGVAFKGGYIEWWKGASATAGTHRHMFMNSVFRLVLSNSVQGASTDAGNYWIDFDDGSASFGNHNMTISAAGAIAGTALDIGDGTNKVLISTTGNITQEGTGRTHESEKFKLTAIGGYAIRLTNTTGANTVAGQLVKADPTTNDAVILTAAADDECFGVFLDSGVADDAEAWVVVAGIADVAMGDDEAATAGNWVETNDAEAGYADATSATPNAAPAHFEEIGHCIETVAAGGGGTHILARCVLHFN